MHSAVTPVPSVAVAVMVHTPGFSANTTPFVVTVANGGNGYFPSLLGFEHGGYEPDTTKYVPGTAETLADTYVSMLGQLHDNR